VCPISLLFANADSEMALSVALRMDAPLEIVLVLISVASQDCRASLTAANEQGLTPVAQALALRRSTAVVFALLDATLAACVHVYAHVVARAVAPGAVGDDSYVQNGFELYKEEGRFVARQLCYMGEDGTGEQHVNTRAQAQAILDTTLGTVAAHGLEMSCKAVTQLLFSVLGHSDFGSYGASVLPTLLAKLSGHRAMREWHNRGSLLIAAVRRRVHPEAVQILLSQVLFFSVLFGCYLFLDAVPCFEMPCVRPNQHTDRVSRRRTWTAAPCCTSGPRTSGRSCSTTRRWWARRTWTRRSRRSARCSRSAS